MARRSKILGAAALLLIVWSVFAPVLAELLVVEKPLERADAILVLGGSQAYVERTHKAAELFRKGASSTILLTNDGLQAGWDEDLQRNPYFVERAKWELIDQGVPAESIKILSPDASGGTKGEARVVAVFASEVQLRSLLLVTSDFHSRRALWTFERAMRENQVPTIVGIEVSADQPGGIKIFYWWLTVHGWRSIGLEYLKLAYYFFTGAL